MNLINRGSAMILAALLTACGAEDDSNFAPTVSAGTDKIASGGQVVVLTATAEDTNGTIETYTWTQTSGTAVTIEDADEDSMRFDAPVLDAAETLEFKVVVTDNENASAADSVEVLVNAGIAAPENLTIRVTGRTAVLEWDAVEKADSYLIYKAFESFSGLGSIENYAVLDGADRAPVPLPTDGGRPFTQLRNLDMNQRYFFTITAAFTAAGSTELTESVPANDVSRLIGASFTASSPLNDTTILECLDSDRNWTACPVNGLAAQDGEIGRTPEDEADELDKVGTGIAGFDFTLLDATGEELSPGTPEADCLRDNLTGLVWELKKPRDSMRRARNRYSWYSTNEDTNGGEPGLVNGPECGGGVCNTFAYLTRLNQAELCGLTSWRLPVVRDMRSIGDIGLACHLDGEGCRYELEPYYWTGTTHAQDTTKAYQVTLDGRTDVPMPKSSMARFIAVAISEEDNE